MGELDSLKYEIYKKSGKKDYLTFKQFIENQNVAYTFSELQNREKKENLKMIGKKTGKKKKNDYKIPTTKVVKE